MILKNQTVLQQRLIVGGIAALLTLIVIYFSNIPIFKPLFCISVVAVICSATSELYNIFRAKGLNPANTLGLSIGALYTIAVAISTQYPEAKMLPEFVLLFSLLITFLYFFYKGTSPLLNLSATLFAVIYIAIPLSCMIRITYFFNPEDIQDGRLILLYLLIVTKITDIGGFFVGKTMGKGKLAPYISPKKTWEGAIGGLVAAVLASLTFKLIFSFFNLNTFNLSVLDSILLGAAISIFAQIGDLSESLLKRDGGIKDSSQMPGLGGMLDIVDSLIFSAPLIYLCLKTALL